MAVQAPIAEAVTVFCPRRPGDAAPSFACERIGPATFRITCALGDHTSTLACSAATQGPLHEPLPVELDGELPGFHAVAQLPAGADEHAIVAAAHRRSVGLYAMSSYRMTARPAPPQLVLGFGNLTTDAIQEGIGEIADLLR